MRETGGPTEDQADIRERGLRNTHIARQPVAKPDAVGVDGVGRIKRDGDAVEPQARFIHDGGVEDMRFADGANLAMRIAMIAPSGNRVSLQIRLRTHILLESIEAMQRIAETNLLEAIAGELVNLHRPGRERNIIVPTIRERDERSQCSRRRCIRFIGGDCCLIGLRNHCAVLQNALMLPQLA